MNRVFLVSIISLLLPFSVFAQTQKGYVKTKGRLSSNGAVVAGSRLSGVAVTLKGRNAVLSGAGGTFVLAIPGSSYYLQNVQKQGYVLADADVLSRQYVQSENPLVLVLEESGRLADDRLQAERKIRRTLERRLQQREDELETLKEEHRITEEAYRQQLQQLYAQQKNNERLISEMAERYAKIDFDQVDEFNRRISDCILNGRLTEADSLLKTKGDINSRASNLRVLQEQNAKDEAELAKRKKKLEKNKQLAQRSLEDIAQDCYSKYEIFKMQHQNDSAAYYVELRASLDTTNIEWGIAAGKFYQKYLAAYDKAEWLFERCMRNAVALGKENLLSECYEALGSIYTARGMYDKAIEYFQKDYDVSLSLFGEHHQYVVASLINLGDTYRKKGDFDKAVELMTKAIGIMDGTEGISVGSRVKVYGSFANLYSSRNLHDKALEYYMKAKEMLDSCSENYPIETITTYVNIGYVYNELGQYEKALEWDRKAYELISSVLGKTHPKMADVLSNIGAVYLRQKQYGEAHENVRKSLEINKSVYGQQSPNLIVDYNNLGRVQHVMKQYKESIESYTLSLLLCEKHLPSNHPYVATIYNNIGSVYIDMDGEEDKAMHYYELALKMRIDKFGENNSSVAIVYNNIGKLYQKKGDKENALRYLEKARDIFEKALGKDHPNTKAVQKSIDNVLSLTN